MRLGILKYTIFQTVLTILPEKVGLTPEDAITVDLLKNTSSEDFVCVRHDSDHLSQYPSFIFGQLRSFSFVFAKKTIFSIFLF